MTSVIIKTIRDFNIVIQDDYTLFLRWPCYRIWIDGKIKLNVPPWWDASVQIVV